MTPSEATGWIVAALAAYPSVAREEFINKLMVEILLPACTSQLGIQVLHFESCSLFLGMLLSDGCVKG